MNDSTGMTQWLTMIDGSQVLMRLVPVPSASVTTLNYYRWEIVVQINRRLP